MSPGSTAGRLRTRPAGPADEHFLEGLDAAVRARELGSGLDPSLFADLLALQYRARRAGWHRDAPHHEDLVVLWDDDPVGRLVLDRRDDGLRVVDLAVLPEHQGRGVGTAVLGAVVEEADTLAVPVSLHVAIGSPALRLYERLGFRRVGASDTHLLLERGPRLLPA